LGRLPWASANTVQTPPPWVFDLVVEKPVIKTTIHKHPEFAAFICGMNAHFASWRQRTAPSLLRGKVSALGMSVDRVYGAQTLKVGDNLLIPIC
jgi:hypothetical protein